MTEIWISAIALAGSTILGALIGFAVKELPHSWTDTIMGYCAGLMLAAATIGLILPASELAPEGGWWMVPVGVILGAMFLNLLDLVTPHMHHITGLDQEEHRTNANLNRVLLFVLAIAIHKFPEGLAAGVSFNTGDVSDGLSLSFALSIQNVPEALVIIVPLLLAGVSKLRTLLIAFGIGLLEIIGLWVGYGLGAISQAFLPIMLAFAGGSMLYIVSDEMIPETHSHGHHKPATYALLLGFLTMLFIDTL